MSTQQIKVRTSAQKSSAQGGLSRATSNKGKKSIGLTQNEDLQRRMRMRANQDFLAPVSTLELSDKFENEEPEEKPHKVKKDKKQKSKGKKWAKRIFLTLLLLIVAAGVAVYFYGDSLVSKITNGESSLFDLIVSKNVELKKDTNGRTNVLIFGTSGYDMQGTEGDYAHDGAQLTDSIMILSFDQETKDLAMVNLPRDLYIGSSCGIGKVNEVFYCNNLNNDNEVAGATALENKMEEIFNVDIHYFVHLDWAALIQIVDSIGGITVTLDEDINDYYYTKTVIQAGVPTTLNGEQALGLARARHGTTGGDFTRGNSQQKILIAIQDKVMQEGISLTQALGVVNTVGDNVRTDFSMDEMRTIFSLASSMSLSSMRQVPLVALEDGSYYLTTAELNGYSYVTPMAGVGNYTQIQKYLAQMFSSNPVTREAANIIVLNGSGEPGVASLEKAKLAADGYVSPDTGDAPEGEYTSNYYVYNISDKLTGTAAALAERYGVTVLPADQLPAGIYANYYDFVIIIGNTTSETTE